MSKNQPGPRSTPGVPRWVKVFVVILIVLILFVIVVHIIGFRFDHGAGALLFDSFTKPVKLAIPYL